MDRDRQVDLLLECLPRLSAYVRRIVRDRQTASDILQEVSARVLAAEGPDDDDPARFLAYCRGVARHVAAADWRLRKQAGAQLPLEGAVLDEIKAPSLDVEAHVDARSWMARLAARVDRQELELLVRRYVHGERGTEIADDLSQSSGAIRMRLMRLRSTLLDITRGCRPSAA